MSYFVEFIFFVVNIAILYLGIIYYLYIIVRYMHKKEGEGYNNGFLKSG